MAKRSSRAAFVFLAFLCVRPALAAGDGESLVDSVCRIIDSSALAQDLPVAFLTRLIWRESNFQPDAVSPVGARGIAQFMPGTAAERGLANPNDPEAAIPKAAELLANLKQRFGNLGLAAAAYNAGAARVASWLAGMGQLPLETRDYVITVTGHPVEDWSGISAAKLTDDAVFPESSCVQHIAAVRRAEPVVFANSALWAPWSAQISSGFSKGAATWNTYVAALNTYLSSLQIQKFYNTHVSSQLHLGLFVCAAVIYFLLAYFRRQIKAVHDELRQKKILPEAILRRGTIDSTKPMLSKRVLEVARREFLRAERAERLFDGAERRPLWRRLGSFDRKDHATAQGLFEALGQKGAAASQVNGSTPATPASPKPVASAGGPTAFNSMGKAQQKPAVSPPEVIPFADVAYRRPLPQAEKAKSRRLKPLLLGTGLVLFAIFSVPAIYDPPLNSTFATTKSQVIADLASAVDVLKEPLEAITGASEREEERSAMRDLSATLTKVTIRVDQIEHEYGARLDRLSERIDQDSSSRFAEIAARLDKLENKAAVPATPASEFADVVARLDKLEKRVAVAAVPASEFANITTRLNKLEKRSGVPATYSQVADSGPRLDRTEKRPAVPAASSAKPPATSKQSTLMARAEPSASSPENPKPLLRDYSVEDVRDGVAVVDGRYGPQQVAPGDFIPGAGRVLRIERRGGDWFVVTSLGVIASGPSPD